VDRWERLDRRIGGVEKFLLALMMAMMILIAFAQILLRNFLDTGLQWGDALVRYLVVWVGFIGAALAVRDEKHITIDVISSWLPAAGRHLNGIVTRFFSCLICALLTYAAGRFVMFEYRMGEVDFLGLPLWSLQLVIPVSLGLMTLRYGVKTVKEWRSLQQAKVPPRNGSAA
jgi:C4-dicarboxylate transporter DctQ subunit